MSTPSPAPARTQVMERVLGRSLDAFNAHAMLPVSRREIVGPLVDTATLAGSARI